VVYVLSAFLVCVAAWIAAVFLLVHRAARETERRSSGHTLAGPAIALASFATTLIWFLSFGNAATQPAAFKALIALPFLVAHFVTASASTRLRLRGVLIQMICGCAPAAVAMILLYRDAFVVNVQSTYLDALVLAPLIGCLALGPGLLLGALLCLHPRLRREVVAGQCVSCGYDRRGIAPEVPCPECGTQESSHVEDSL
jgi:hypothetical protein